MTRAQGVVGEPRPISDESAFVDAVRGRLDGLELRIERRGRMVILSGRLARIEPVLDRQALLASGVVFSEARGFNPSEINFSPIATCYIEDGSVGKAADFESCDAVDSVDGRPVTTLDDLDRTLRSAQSAAKTVRIAVKRVASPKGKSYFEYRQLSLPIADLHWICVENDRDAASRAHARCHDHEQP